MKKVISVGLALTLLFLCCVPALARELTPSNTTGTVVISTGADKEDEWELSYPADAVIPWESENYGIGSVTATKMTLSPGKTVKVTVESQNGWLLVNDADSSRTIAYTLSGAQAVEFFPGDYGLSFPLSAAVTDSEWRQAAAGEHTDLLVFTAEYTNA